MLAAAGTWYQRNTSNAPARESTVTPTTPAGTNSNEEAIELTIGSPTAPLTVVEYGDFKCPNCAKFHAGAGRQVRAEYIDTGKVKLLYKNLPYIAPDSRVAAEGAYCAAKQHSFKTYHDGVYDYMNSRYESGEGGEFDNVLTVEKLSEYLNKDADTKAFQDCVRKSTYKTLVNRDLKDSELDKATGTPTFIIDNQRITGAQPFAIFKAILDTKLR